MAKSWMMLVALGGAWFAQGCGPSGSDADASSRADGGVVSMPDGSTAPGPDGATGPTPDDASVSAPDGARPTARPGAPLLFRLPPAPAVLADTADPSASACGAFARVEGGARRIVIDLDACAARVGAPADAAGVVGSLTVRLASSTETVTARVEPTDAAVPGPAFVVGPLQSAVHGFVTTLGAADRAFAVEIPGTATADVRVELSAFLVPATSSGGGAYVHLLPSPRRWYASNPNDEADHRDVWSTLGTSIRVPVPGASEGATAMLGAVHLGPGVWREVPAEFFMGPAGAPMEGLTRWASTPVDAHFPWRYSSLFVVGAGADGRVEMRGRAPGKSEFDRGLEPWVDAYGWLSPRADGGLVLRPLSVPVRTAAPIVTRNDEDVRVQSGIAEAAGVVGTLEFDLPHWPFDEQYRYFNVMVAPSPDVFPGAIAGLEGVPFTTVQLNQNGRVTAQFVTRTDAAGAFVMRHYSYRSGASGGADPRLFEVSVSVRIDAVLTRP